MDRPGPTGWAHLVSDRPGDAGGRELRLIGVRLGIRRPVHRAHTYAEHLDIRGDEIRRALAAGVVVIRRRDLALLLRAKRKAGREPGRTGLPAAEHA